MGLFRRRRVLDHPSLGRLTYDKRGGYWEGELEVAGAGELVTLVIPAPEQGPSARQAAFCTRLLDDLDGLFARCVPVLEPDFERWTQRPVPATWRDEFSLTGLGLPEDGDETKPWDVTYWVGRAGHWFTAYFEGGRASYTTVDG